MNAIQPKLVRFSPATRNMIRAILLGAGLLSGLAEAGTCTSVQSGNWNTTSTWSCTGGVTTPGSADSVIIVSPHTVTLDGNRIATNLQVDVGATLDDGNGRDLTLSGNAVINGTYDATGNSGNLIMTGNGVTLSGTGTIIDINRIQIDGNVTIPAGSNLNLTLRSEIRIGNNSPGTLTIDGTLDGTGMNAGTRLIRLDNNNTSNVIVNGMIDAPNSFVEVQSGGTVTNNGAVSLQYLDGNNNATSAWVQGANSNLTLTQPAAQWVGTFDASATGNTVTFNGTATPFDPATYYNLAGTGVTCPLPAGITVLGTSPCAPPSGSTSVTASPTNCVNDASIGSQAWSTLTGPFASDNGYATASIINSQITNYLKCTGYNFGIPSNATITGIALAVENHSQRTINDYAARLVKGGVIQPTNYATNTRFPAADAYTTYGGSSDLWGGVWTATDINSVNFGAAFAAQRGPFNTADTAFVDHMPITVTYTLPSTPIAEYRMDEASWNGTANEVVDSSASGFHGAASGLTTKPTTSNAGPAIVGSPGTCRYGVFNRSNKDYLALSGFPNLTAAAGEFAITAWINVADNTLPGQRIFIDDETNSSPGGWGFSVGETTAVGGLRFYYRQPAVYILDTVAIPSNQWLFVALSVRLVAGANASTATIYAYNTAGTLVTSNTGTFTWSAGSDPGPASIGGETNASGEGTNAFGFGGNLDEVRVYQTVLSQAQVAAIATETHACTVAAPDHLEIQHASGAGLTCAASTLTIKACADAACTTPYTGGVSGTLSATGTPTVNWDGTTGGATGAGFVIPNGSSSVTKNVQVATAGTVSFGITSSSPAPNNATTCNFGTPACTFTASSAGFVFSNSTTGSAYTIPAQVSGINSPPLYLRALQASTSNPAVCTPAIISQTTGVTMGYTCNNPAACQAGSLTTINATAVAPAGTSVNLTFDANGSAPITARYDDVGEITLNASKAVTPFGGATAVTLNGSSNAFVVAPHHFGFSAVTAGPIKAGGNFSATVTAYNGLGTPAATKNFGQEAAPGPEGVTLTSTLVSPVGGANPALGGNVIAGGSFTNGVATVGNLTWGEVGNITLNAGLTGASYLGSGLNATGTSATVGAFIPDHLDTAVVATATSPIPCPAGLACPTLYNGAVYSAQPFSVQVTARNLADTTTTNYDGTLGFAKDVALTAWDALGSTTTQNPNGALANNAIALASFSLGVATTATPTYSLTTTTPTDIYLRALDTDSVTSLRSTPAASVEGGVKIVSGRINISNAHGSELLPLPLTATVQYHNGTSWVTSASDNLTQFDTDLSTAGGNVVAAIVSGLGGGINMVAPGVVTMANGVRTFTLAKPGVAGSVDISLNAPTYLPGNTARATFGVYKGNNEFIYLRENY